MILAACSMTSMTMKGGTSLRVDGINSALARAFC
jgi:hypothetical protein